MGLGKQPRTICAAQDAAMRKAKGEEKEDTHEVESEIEAEVEKKMKNLIFSLILVHVWMDTRTKQHFKKYSTS